MEHVIHNVAALLHKMNDDINKVCQKNRPIFTVINVWKQCSHVKQITFPMLIPENKLLNRPITTDFSIVGCLWKSVGKIVWCELDFTLRIATVSVILHCVSGCHRDVI